MSRADPYHDRKVYHYADKMNAAGNVSALCYASPRAINLKIALWTIRPEAVTCQKCKEKLSAAPLPSHPSPSSPGS